MTHPTTHQQKHYRGVSYTYDYPQAQIRINGRLTYLGIFKTPELAAEAYDEAAKKYHGTKAKLNFTDRLITVRQEQIYRLCSPDFYNLSYKHAGMLLGISAATICRELKRIKKKCPSLFPLYYRPHNRPMYVSLSEKSLYYQPWMDDKIIMKF